MFRFEIVKTPEKICLSADFHHIIFYGGSLDLFIKEIISIYKGNPPIEEEISLLDWAVLEEKNENSNEWVEDKEYFDILLQKCEGATEIPSDMPNQLGKGEFTELIISVNRKKCEDFCKVNGVTSASLFLPATSYTIGRWVSSKDLYLSTISSGKSNPHILNSMGRFVRTLSLRLKMEDDYTALDFVHESQKSLSDGIYLNDIFLHVLLKTILLNLQ